MIPKKIELTNKIGFLNIEGKTAPLVLPWMIKPAQ